VIPSDEAVMITHSWDALRSVMWNYVGIVRSDKRLEFAKKRIEMLKTEINDYYQQYQITPDLIELRNLLTCAELIINSASFRHESRGLHYSLDYKRELPKALPTIVTPKN
jgi:L-aspartate oxidase